MGIIFKTVATIPEFNIFQNVSRYYIIDNEPVLISELKNIKKNYHFVVEYRMKSYICNRLKE